MTGQTMFSRHVTEDGKCCQGEVFPYMLLSLTEDLVRLGEPVNVKCEF